jgi:hypothetical protein
LAPRSILVFKLLNCNLWPFVLSNWHISITTLLCQIRFFQGRFTFGPKKTFLNKFFFFRKNPSYPHYIIHHISGNRSLIGSIEAPFRREYPDEETVTFSRLTIYFYGRGLPSKWENATKRHWRVKIGRIGCATQPQNFISRPIMRVHIASQNFRSIRLFLLLQKLCDISR